MRALQNIISLEIVFRLINVLLVEGNEKLTGLNSSLMNPEETGSYSEGDIMLADHHRSEDFKNNHSTWPGFKIPHVIEGNYTSSASTVNETLLMNPEEMGEYAEGDLLLAKDHDRIEYNYEAIRWPNATIPVIIRGKYSARQRDMLIQAMYTIQMWTCIQFVPYRKHKEYIVIRNVKNAGCASFIGRAGRKSKHVVNLEAPLCFTKIGTTLHELLHAIGLLHEHNRSDRDQYVTINKKNILKGKSDFFKTYNQTKVNNHIVQYNYNSIMHYSAYAATKGRKTIKPKVSGVTIGQRDLLSVGDAVTVNNLYNCNVTAINVIGTKNISRLLPNFEMKILASRIF